MFAWIMKILRYTSKHSPREHEDEHLEQHDDYEANSPHHGDAHRDDQIAQDYVHDNIDIKVSAVE